MRVYAALCSLFLPENQVTNCVALFSAKFLNLSALKAEDSQATLRIATLRLAPEGSHRPHASGF